MADTDNPLPAEEELAEKQNLITGSIHRNIWSLSIPMILEMATMSVTQIVDTYWVGKLGSAALAAVTISITLRWVINSMANGLGIGGMAGVARRIGARSKAKADHATWQAVLLAIFVSLVLGALGILVAEPILRILGAEAEVLAMGMSYLRILYGGLFTLVLVFVINSLLRGAGEARLALWVLALSQGLTLVLDPLLIFGWGPFPVLGVSGSAWASVLGFGAGALLQIANSVSGRARIAINVRNLWPDFPPDVAHRQNRPAQHCPDGPALHFEASHPGHHRPIRHLRHGRIRRGQPHPAHRPYSRLWPGQPRPPLWWGRTWAPSSPVAPNAALGGW